MHNNNFGTRLSMNRIGSNAYSRNASNIRDQLKKYFMNNGSIEYHYERI